MCTAIKIDYEDGSVMGRTMDLEPPLDYNILYFPRDYNYGDDLLGQPIYTKYKSLGICFRNRNPLKDGINEHGLVGLTNDFGGFNLYSSEVDEEKLNISSLDFLSYALSSYKSIDEMLGDLSNINISLKNYRGEKLLCPDFHYMFTDTSKKAVVIEPKKGKLIYFNNPYGVMTNSPAFDSHIRRLNKFMDLDNLEDFNSAKLLPAGYDPVSRFIKAFYLTRMNVESRDYKEALAHGYNILGAMALPKGFIKTNAYREMTYTMYTCLYDSVNKYLTVRTSSNPSVYQIGFEDIKDEGRKQSIYLEGDFTSQKII